MNINLITTLVALVREISRNPEVVKHNTKKNRFKNILMLCFIMMFFGFAVMTEQAILQTQEKHRLAVQLETQKQKIEGLENDLYIRDISESAKELPIPIIP